MTAFFAKFGTGLCNGILETMIESSAEYKYNANTAHNYIANYVSYKVTLIR
jgi:hypothetical protein